MPFSFIGVAPHSPFLLPTIGLEKINQLTNTKIALEELEQELYLAKITTLIILTAHGEAEDQTILVHGAANLLGDLRLFGDVTTVYNWLGHPALATKLTHHARFDPPLFFTTSQAEVDYGVTVPLSYLSAHSPSLKILVLSVPNQITLEQTKLAANQICETVSHERERIGILSSLDLSHSLSTNAPNGYQSEGEIFDRTIRTALANRCLTDIKELPETTVQKAASCSWTSLQLFSEIIGEHSAPWQELSYEAPFGIGHLTGFFHL